MNAQIVGYGVIHHHFFNHLFIELVMIDKKYRQKGYGKCLITYFKENRQGDKLFTSTNKSNYVMQKMLIKLGFIESDCIENLDENDSEIIYCFIKK